MPKGGGIRRITTLMKIAVIGASGKAGALIAQEALDRGMEVTAIVRDKKKVDMDKYAVLEKDIFSIAPEDVEGYDAVVCAYGVPADKAPLIQDAFRHLINVFEQVPEVRLLFIGGAASLYTDFEKTRQLMETIPPEWAPVPYNTLLAFNEIQKSKANWTFFSPAGFFDAAGPRTGKYTLGTDYVILNKSGDSYLSYADYAIAMVDEIVNKRFLGKRFTAVSEKAAP
ncbi:MAG: NAD(P)H-binding protein [Clostridiales bacterium]|jgi:putative NADH-flavin reductase|nr:NAD(P)H-binding protein [Clostridiales bacterium]